MFKFIFNPFQPLFMTERIPIIYICASENRCAPRTAAGFNKRNPGK